MPLLVSIEGEDTAILIVLESSFFCTDYSAGFGGKFGVQSDRVDKSAKGWGESQKTDLHSSQTDSSKKKGSEIRCCESRKQRSGGGNVYSALALSSGN